MSFMKKIYYLTLMFFLFCSLNIKAQDYTGIRMGIKIPYTYNVSYYARISDRFGAYGGLQMVTFPFGTAPLAYMKAWGADPAMVEVLREPFSIGAGVEIGAHYYFGSDNRRYYVALSLDWMNLLKRSIEDTVIETAFGVNLDDYPEGPILKESSVKPLTLNTNYLNLGLTFGKRFLLPYNPNWELALELQIDKTIYSHHFLFSDYRYLTPVEEMTSKGLKQTMLKYGWFPTFNVIFTYIIK